MGTMTYYVVLAFKRSEDGGDIVACDPKGARSAEQAIQMAGSLARIEGHCGAIVVRHGFETPGCACSGGQG